MRRWQSIAFRLPLLVSILLVATLSLSTFLAYRQVEAVVFDSAASELTAAAGQVANMLATAHSASTAAAEEVARDPRVLAHLRDPAARDPQGTGPSEVQSLLTGLADQAPATVGVELWTSEGTRVAAAGISALQPPPDIAPGWRRGVTALREEGGILRYEIAVPVRDLARGPAPGAGATPPPSGWIVLRRVLGSAATAELLASFVGEGAAFYLANSDGSLWTDLSRPTAAPVAEAPREGFHRYLVADTLAVAAAALSVPGAPWISWAEISQATIVPPIQAFLRQRLATALALLVIATVGAWALTRPFGIAVVRLNEAATAIAGGDYSQRVAVDRRDEIGALSESFNAMAQKIEDQRIGLEEQVRDRTAKLRQAYRDLVDAQNEIVKKEKLATLGQLASGVGHELRNPLGVMTNAVYYLEMVLKDAPATVSEYFGILKAQIGLSEKIVGDLLDFSRVKTPVVEAVRVADLVDAQIARLGSLGKVTLSKEIPNDLPPAYADPIQVGQVLLNLLMNGVQAMDRTGGTLRVSARLVGSNQIAISVKDEGEGIAPANRSKIFEPLFTTKARGIGLGLAVSRTLAEKNGGTLGFESLPGEGATFTVTLPARPPEARG